MTFRSDFWHRATISSLFLGILASPWRAVTIQMNRLIESDEAEVSFHVKEASVKNPIGLAFFPTDGNPLYLAAINGTIREDRSTVGLTVQYDR